MSFLNGLSSSERKQFPRSEVWILHFDILVDLVLQNSAYFSFGINVVKHGTIKYRVLPMENQKPQHRAKAGR